MLLNSHAQQQLLSHTGRCFDIRYSVDGQFLLSASEDGTAILWDAKTKKVCTTLKHNKESEVLRAAYLNSSPSLISTCGADGRAIIWEIFSDEEVEESTALFLPNTTTNNNTNNSTSNVLNDQLNKDSGARSINERISRSSSRSNKKTIKKQAVLSHGATQIYACECFDINNSASGSFMTAADSSVYLWDINTCIGAKSSSSASHIWTITANSSSGNSGGVSPSNSPGQEGENDNNTSFGGPRNPDNQIFVFDAKISPRDTNIIALALSDGNIRQIDIRNPCFASLNKTSTSFSPSHSPSNSPSTSSTFSSPSSSSSNPSNHPPNNTNRHRNNGVNNMSSMSHHRENNETTPLPNFSSISLSGLSTSPTKKARVGNSHATSVSFSEDSLSLLAALGSGDVAVLDLRMGVVRTLLHSHQRTCFGAAFISPHNNRTNNNNNGISNHSSSSSRSGSSGNDNDNAYSESKSIDHSDDTPCTSSSSSSSHCISWSSDCSVRSWDISVDGLCTDPTDTVTIPDFPIFCCAVKGGERGSDFACGGGSGDASFVGTPLHAFYKPSQ